MKTIEEIYGAIAGAFEEETGLRMSRSGEAALRFWAVAAQIHALYAQADWTLRQAFPQTAEGEYLEHFAAMRALTRREATFARGAVRFELSGESAADTEIPAGTVCLAGGQVRFVTDTAAVIPAGELSAVVPVTAAEAGSQGNVAAGAVAAMAVAPAGVSRCCNEEAFAGGSDRETDEALRKRVLDSYTTLPNGANSAYYRAQALSVAGVAGACVKPRARGLGTVDVVISSAEGLPGEELLEQVREKLAAAREIAVDVQVLAPQVREVSVQVQLKAAAGHDYETVETAVRGALEDYFTGHLLGQSVTRARLGALIYAVDGVENYRLLEPGEDVASAEDALPVLTGITASELEG